MPERGLRDRVRRPCRQEGSLSVWTGSERTLAAGTRFHAALHGRPEAPLVVCVHGLGCSHRYFGPLAGHLANDAFVVAPDLPGFGRTPGPPKALDVRGLSRAFAEWLRVTGRAGATMVANSAGCQVVVDVAAHAPELLGPVVLTGPTVDPHARTIVRQSVGFLRDVRYERPQLLTVLAGDYVRAGPRRLFATARHLVADSVESKLPLVPTPAVVMRGERDPVVSRDWAVEVSRLLPSGRFVEVPGAGHALNFSAPEALAQVVRQCLDL